MRFDLWDLGVGILLYFWSHEIKCNVAYLCVD